MNPITKQKNCSICINEIVPPLQQEKTICGHIFHKICLDQWKNYGKDDCPDCRSDLEGRNTQRLTIEFDPNSLDSLLSAREEVLKGHRTCQSQTNVDLLERLDRLIFERQIEEHREESRKQRKKQRDRGHFVLHSVFFVVFVCLMFKETKQEKEIRQIFEKLEKGPLLDVLDTKEYLLKKCDFSSKRQSYINRLDDIMIKRPLSEVLSLKEDLLRYKPDATVNFFLKELDEIIKTKQN